MTEPRPLSVFSDDELRSHSTVFADGLFEDRVALVTGGGSGIGKATAWLLGRLGASVVICGRREKRLLSTAEPMSAAGLSVSYLETDIRYPDQVQRLFDHVRERWGGLDLLINNAGGQFAQPAIDIPVKAWKAVIDVNLSGTWYMMQAAARGWRDAERGGCIVNITAVVERGIPGVAHTCAARSGVIHLSKTVAVEWAPHAIRVNCVAPGVIETEGLKLYAEKTRASFPASNPMLRLGSVWDVAEACCYLAGPSGNFITGGVLTVDGGGQLWGDLWTGGKPDYFAVD